MPVDIDAQFQGNLYPPASVTVHFRQFPALGSHSFFKNKTLSNIGSRAVRREDIWAKRFHIAKTG